MKNIFKFVIVMAIGTPIVFSGHAGQAGETIKTRIGDLSFTHDFANGYPTKETVRKLYDERDFQRAVQAYIWAMPMVSTGEVREVLMQAAGTNYGDLIPVNKLPGLSRFLTANATTPYMMSWVNLAEMGPVVIDIPAGLSAGFINDMWQRPVADLGLPGPNKGKGGKFLLLGPGQSASAGTDEYTIVRSPNFNNLILLRLLSPKVDEQIAMRKNIRIYSQKKGPSTDSGNLGQLKHDGRTLANSPRGMAYWEQLSHWINEEPVHERDRIMMAMLRPLGIEKGKPFQPNERQTKILNDAVVVGEAMIKANTFEKRHMDLAHYADGVQWEFALVLDPSQESKYYTQLDERAAWFYEASTTSQGMVTKTPGVGSIYLSTYKDEGGEWLNGANNYRLRVPANAPVKQFWSMTIYDVNTRMLIKNDTKTVDRSSRMDLLKNSDGSIDLYFGPKAPKGFEKNWVPTVAGKAWFPYFRLYAPTKAHFDRSWVLPDIEKAK